MTSNIEKTLYNIDGEIVGIQKKDISDLISFSNNFLQTSIRQPLSFIYTTEVQGDWYSDTASKNNHLWSDLSGNKGIYDPCPSGWRTPVLDSNSRSPWSDLISSGNFDPGTGENYPGLGYYPVAGYRTSSSGALTSVGDEGHVWIGSTINEENNAYHLKFQPYSTLPKDPAPRASGFSVRCVLEK